MRNKPGEKTKSEYERYLNKFAIPEKERQTNGGKTPRNIKAWGTWLRVHDPAGFEVGFNEWKLKHRG